MKAPVLGLIRTEHPTPLAQCGLTMADRRHFAQRIDREIRGLSLLARFHVEYVKVVGSHRWFPAVYNYTL